MHIEIRKNRNRKKYYLARSYRAGSKIRKVRIYLGSNLNKTELKLKETLAKGKISLLMESVKTIHDPYVTALSAKELDELKQLEPKGLIKLSHLSEKDWLKFTETFAYDTNAIEGSTVEKPEAKEIIENNKWPDKSKDEISETLGVSEAVKHLRGTREQLSLKLIKELHRIVFKNSKSFAGNLRRIGEEVGVVDSIGNVVHHGAPSAQVEKLLRGLVSWYKKNRQKYPPLVLAIVVHNQFENIHPFGDGNGRVGRLLLLNILIKNGLPPVNIELKNRKEYYAALQAYQVGGNIRPMIGLMLKEYRLMRYKLKR